MHYVIKNQSHLSFKNFKNPEIIRVDPDQKSGSGIWIFFSIFSWFIWEHHNQLKMIFQSLRYLLVDILLSISFVQCMYYNREVLIYLMWGHNWVYSFMERIDLHLHQTNNGGKYFLFSFKQNSYFLNRIFMKLSKTVAT